jgi:hypothetical protein
VSRLRERLAALAGPVELRLYRKPDSGRLVLSPGVGCATCDLTEELLRSVADAAPERISFTVIDVGGPGEAPDEVPTVTVAAPGEEPRIAFQGLPSGYEFATLLDAIERVSVRTGDLAPELSDRLSRLEQDVEVMVFVTPTCPYCQAQRRWRTEWHSPPQGCVRLSSRPMSSTTSHNGLRFRVSPARS